MILLLLACRGPAPPPLEVQWWGCAEVRDGPVCEHEGNLGLWVADAALAPRLAVEGAGLSASAEPLATGVRWSVSAAPGATRLELSVDGEPAWGLDLAPFDLAPPLVAARASLHERDYAGAEEAVLRAVPGLDEGQLAHAFALLARVRLARDDPDDAIAQLRQAVQHRVLAGHRYGAVKDGVLLADNLLARHRVAEARAALPDTSAPALRGNLDVAYVSAYYEARLARTTGDVRTAIRDLQSAAELAERSGQTAWRDFARDGLADMYQRAGMHDEALALLAEDLRAAEAGDPCDRARYLNNYAWGVLLAREDGLDTRGPVETDPMTLLERARADLGPACWGWAQRQANIAVSMALAALEAGDRERAAALLDEARSLAPEPEPEVVRWSLLVEGRLADDPDRALASFRALEHHAVQTASLEFEWLARAEQARVLALAGRRRDAVAVYERAEQLFVEQSFLVPLHLGRGALLSQHERVTAAHVALLLDGGDMEGAMRVVRSWRASLLAGLRPEWHREGLTAAQVDRLADLQQEYEELRREEEAGSSGEWALSLDEVARLRERRDRVARDARAVLDQTVAGRAEETSLRGPNPGELLLAWFPEGSGWLVFAQDAEGTQVARTPEAGELPGMSAAIARARVVTLLPHGRLAQVDLHALPLDGEPLFVRKPVRYGLDLGRDPDVDPAPDQVLVVADPDGGLPHAREEGDLVVERLRAGGARPTFLAERQATRASLQSALAGADLFHYAGHARSDDSAWDSRLLLTDEGALTAGDVLALPSVPRLVVLSACESARSTRANVETVGLAQAFVVAGSDAVIATSRPVSDEAGPAFALRFYAALAREPRVAAAFRATIAELVQARPELDWASFRLVTP